MKALEAEFAQIVKENRSTIYTVCYMFSKDPDEVGDLFQETLINLWRGFASFKGKSEVSTWIWRVSLNTCISSERKKKLRRTEPLSMELNVFDSRDEDNRQIQMLHSRIHRLQPFDRAIVLLWLENLSYEEIASIVGISVKNVSVRLFRIKEELKKMSND
ncbi:MAG: sigma-70 family RNA polymerase sigma factor [Bacteroidaceae bacterium]|jgi:RNA polymerase sigma-70 factor (ECF subfamily)|nr:sigma-70 family RNA polymerase sigma factor [Bacteroidaceae bacterium]MBQ8804909.1 sigma-70 family RNA polymerase sigma factor [Bacteroidaceae bacterium]